MAYGVSKAFDDVLSRRDKTTIRGVDTTERIFYISPYWLKELLIRNNGANDVQIRLSEREKPITVKASGGELNLSGEFAYFFASAPAKQDIDILYRPVKKLITKKMPPIALELDGIDDYGVTSKHDDYYTLEASVLAYGIASNSRILCVPRSTTSWIVPFDEIELLSLKTKQFRFSTNSASAPNNYVVSSVLAEFNKVYHVLGQRNKDTYELYVDLNKSTATATAQFQRYGNPLYIGTRTPAPAETWNGLIFYARAYGRPLSEREVKHNYYDPFKPIQKDLALYLSPFSIDIVNSVWYDESGHENHATIYGAQLKELWRPEQ
ncbi:LamG-like jellyroll fold domain-containing protein [Thermococcus sp.]